MFLCPCFNQVWRTAVFFLPRGGKERRSEELRLIHWLEVGSASLNVCDRNSLPAGTSASHSELHFTLCKLPLFISIHSQLSPNGCWRLRISVLPCRFLSPLPRVASRWRASPTVQGSFGPAWAAFLRPLPNLPFIVGPSPERESC